MARFALVAALIWLFALASPALAADRYAAPAASGSGNCSSAANACTFQQAVANAGPNDRLLVIADRGDYTLNTGIAVGPTVEITGISGRPRLVFTSGGLNLTAPGSSVSNLRVESPSTSAGLSLNGGTGDRLFVKGSAAGSVACSLTDTSTLTNSLCWGSGNNSTAVAIGGSQTSTTDTLRNVTAVAVGTNTRGVAASATPGLFQTIALVNVIARGSAADLRLDTGSNQSSLTIDARHVSYATTDKSGEGSARVNDNVKQTAAPVFVDAAAGDFHQAASSPTIDAGVTEAANKTADFDGEARTLNGVTDIGFDERAPGAQPAPPAPVAPSVVTGEATSVSQTAAVVHGVVDPSGAPTAYRFEYGISTAYQYASADADAGSGTTLTQVQAALTGLAPGTTYHYRLVATNAGGTTFGADRTFTTEPAPSLPPPPPVGRCANVLTVGTLDGTDLGDTLTGTSGADTMEGLGGDDCVDALAGSDRVDGGLGDDTIKGGSGNDITEASAGVDSVRGGTGNDNLSGGEDGDKLSGESGNDRLSGGDGDDQLTGGAGADRVTGGSGQDRITTGDGDDTVFVRDGKRDSINCGAGKDRVTADMTDRLSSCNAVRRK